MYENIKIFPKKFYSLVLMTATAAQGRGNGISLFKLLCVGKPKYTERKPGTVMT